MMRTNTIRLLGIFALVASLHAIADDTLGEDISPQPLNKALTEFANQSGLQIVYKSELVAGIASQGTRSPGTVDEALGQLLANTGLEYRFINDRTVVVETAAVSTGETGPAAQTTEDADDSKVELAKLAVTGTRLPSFTAPSPILVLGKAEMEARGMNSIEDIVRFIPQNFATENSGTTVGGRGRFGPVGLDSVGMVTVNLRGIGSGATLVLVNGRRLARPAGSFGDGTVDVSTIPFEAVERVEVMVDGGSAIYGSDAVGGVINFIMKKDYRGMEIAARYENSSSGGDRVALRGSAGLNWASGSMTASFDYFDQTPVRTVDAGLDIDGDLREQGGRRFVSTMGQPGIIFRPFPPGAPPGSIVGMLPPGDGSSVGSNDIIYVSFLEWITQSGNWNLLPNSNSALAEAVPQSDGYSGYLALSQDIGNQLTLNVNALYSMRRSASEAQAMFFMNRVPASNFYNNFGVPVRINYAFTSETAAGLIVPPSRKSEAERLDLSAALTWDLPIKDWKLDASYTSSQYDLSSETVEFGDSYQRGTLPAVEEALASSDPNTALNLFGDGTLQRANLNDLVRYNNNGGANSSQDDFSLNLTGSLFDLPGGSVVMAFGGQSRNETMQFNNLTSNPLLSRRQPNPRLVTPAMDNNALYAELGIPVVGEANAIPGIRGLLIQLAGRYDHYKMVGPFDGFDVPDSTRTYDDFVPKIGVAWNPIDSLRIRASWGESFQAPGLLDLFQPLRLFPPFLIQDPLNPPSNGGPDAFIRVPFAAGGNPDLQKQTSDVTTIGFDYDSEILPGLGVSVSWSKVDFKDIIGTVAATYGINDPFPLENPDLFPGLVERDENGVMVLNHSYGKLNISRRDSEAIDFDVRYSFTTGLGDLTTGVYATRTLKLEVTPAPAPGIEPIEFQGTNLAPSDWKTRVYVDWLRGSWSGNLTVNYVSGYFLDPDRNFGVIKTDVDSYTTVDLQAAYIRPNSAWKFRAGIKNVFDAGFPFVDNRIGADSVQVDFRRRVIFLDIARKF